MQDANAVGQKTDDHKALRPPGDCPVCSQLRSLQDHLFEMAEFCTYLGDTASFEEEDGIRDVQTEVIGDWLRLASQLERVEIDTWKHAGDDGFYCETAADRYDSDAKHYTTYATSLTRFVFVCNALEEAYRFVSHHYDETSQRKPIAKRDLVYTPALKAAYLVDQIKESGLPVHFRHIADNFVVFFEEYQTLCSPRLSGLGRVSKGNASYALHLARNLRNHVAHGVFPLVDNFEYSSDTRLGVFQNLLFHGCRVATVYMQALLKEYFCAFYSYEYKSIEGAHGKEYERFVENCTVAYLAKLHLNGDFALKTWMSYSEL